MREPETYRTELEQALSFFGSKRVLMLKDVTEYTGMSRDWCREHLGVTKEGISINTLAHRMSKLSENANG